MEVWLVRGVGLGSANVGIQVEELEVSKKKATEMLQSSQGDRMAAVKAYVLPAIKA